MAKVQRTINICDRCGIEHKGVGHDCLASVKAYNTNLSKILEWNDLCDACSIQVDEALTALVING